MCTHEYHFVKLSSKGFNANMKADEQSIIKNEINTLQPKNLSSSSIIAHLQSSILDWSWLMFHHNQVQGKKQC